MSQTCKIEELIDKRVPLLSGQEEMRKRSIELSLKCIAKSPQDRPERKVVNKKYKDLYFSHMEGKEQREQTEISIQRGKGTTKGALEECDIKASNPIKKYYILSSMHSPVEIEKNDTRIPETIRFSNSTQFGVDVTDQMARKYSVKSKFQKLPLQVQIRKE
uniref:Uncharacterized protein n=1 Tax=Glossina austeni TaxID=7395 RepID=A0A1A9V0U8_GLOAU